MIQRICCGNVNCYIVADGKTAVLVDTGREKFRQKVLDACQEFDMRLLVLTHGHVDHVQNAAFLAALSTKSAKAETTDEIAGCAAAMRDHAIKVETGMDLFEIVGTGGDNAQSFNISTASAYLHLRKVPEYA